MKFKKYLLLSSLLAGSFSCAITPELIDHMNAFTDALNDLTRLLTAQELEEARKTAPTNGPDAPTPTGPVTPEALRKAAEIIKDKPLDEILAGLPKFDADELEREMKQHLSASEKRASMEEFYKTLPRAASAKFAKLQKQQADWQDTLSGSVRGLRDARKKLIRTYSRQLRDKELHESIRIAQDLTALPKVVRETAKRNLEAKQLFQLLMRDAYYSPQSFTLSTEMGGLLDKGLHKRRTLSFYFEKMLPIINSIKELEKLYDKEAENLARLDKYVEENEEALMNQFYEVPSKNLLIQQFKTAMQAVAQNPSEENEDAATQIIMELNEKQNKADEQQLEQELDAFLNQKKADYAREQGINPELATLENQLNSLSTKWAQLVVPIIWPRMVQIH